MLLTSPSETGPVPLMKTIGIVVVAALAAGAAEVFAAITPTRRCTRSAAMSASRS